MTIPPPAPDTPPMRELLADAPTSWGQWGADDEIGALNHLTATEVLAAARLIRVGKVFTLQAAMLHKHGDLMARTREPSVRTVIREHDSWRRDLAIALPGGAEYADDSITMNLQATTQYDALGHVWFDDTLYNGFPADSTNGRLHRASVLPIAEHGVVGRGVLLDVARHRGRPHLDDDECIGLSDLLEVAEAQGVELRRHDIVLVRTGRMRHFYGQSQEEWATRGPEPGLVYSLELAEWCAHMAIPNVATDTVGVEVGFDPDTGAKLLLHCALLRNLGVLFTELCDLDAIADDCAEDGVWDFFYAAAPLKVTGASGSPVNPIAIK